MAAWNIDRIVEELQKLQPFDVREARDLASWLWEESYGYSKNKSEVLDEKLDVKLINDIREVASGKPVQYIAGHAWFYGLKLKVNQSVLIPRPETEELVHWIITDHDQSAGTIKILDIGTGSGCIPIALKKNFKAETKISAIDISPEALVVARENAKSHEVQIEYLRDDFLDMDVSRLGQFDIVVSNPPYIDRDKIDPAILHELVHEPSMALYPKVADPDIFYRRICDHLETLLERSGMCYLEINEFRAHEIMEIFLSKGFTKIELRPDMQRKPRMLRIKI